MNRPGLYAGLVGLLGAPNLAAVGDLPQQSLEDWLPLWQEAYLAGGKTLAAGEGAAPSAEGIDDQTARLHPDRIFYYSAAFQALLGAGQAEAILWPLLRTWTGAVLRCPTEAKEQTAWRQVFSRLGLAGLPFTGRIEALDAFLDVVDETLEGWARTNGAWQD